MNARILTVILVVALVLTLLGLVQSMNQYVHLPGNNQGYEPVQPIAYSHRLHAGELGMQCLYCHFSAEKSRHAGIPPANVCMNCHRFVTTPFLNVKAEDERARKENRKPARLISPELKKLYSAMALSDAMLPDSTTAPRPIEWTRIHLLPDFVFFSHRPHVAAGVACQTCHGEVQTMERVRQFSDLSMGWCVNCHRDVNRNGVNGKRVKAPIDCSACHY